MSNIKRENEEVMLYRNRKEEELLSFYETKDYEQYYESEGENVCQ